jgi:hypothetical protein
MATWLDAHRGQLKLTELAARTGFSTFKLSRMLSGKSGSKLTDFFVVLQATTGRVAEFVAALVDIEQVPVARDEHARVRASRALAFEQPWTSAIVALLETTDYASLNQHNDDFIAQRLKVPTVLVRRCLDELSKAGLVARRQHKYRVQQTLTIDTQGQPERVNALRRHWAGAATGRLSSPGAKDSFAYNVFSVTSSDYDRIRDLQKRYYREVRSIVADSRQPDVVALLTLHLVQFDGS